MRAHLVAIFATILSFSARVGKRQGAVGVQALGPEAAVEDPMQAVSVGLPGQLKSSVTPFA